MRRLWIAIVFCLLLSSAALAEEPDTFASGDFDYILMDDGGAKIVKYIGESTKIVIPSQIDGYDVKGIGEYVIPLTLRFWVTDIELPNGLETIDNYAFYACHKLKKINIPDSVTLIGDSALFQCLKLKNITLPDGITEIGDNPFGDCIKASFTVSLDHPYLEVKDNVLFSKPEKRLICCTDQNKSYTVPDGVEVIGAQAFWGCEKLKSIVISNDVKVIEDYAFTLCMGLTEVEVPEGVESLGKRAFYECEKLERISIPDSVTHIGADAFLNCSDRLSVSVPEGSYAEKYCKENDVKYEYSSNQE